MTPRRPTRQIQLGNQHTGIVRVGGGLPDSAGQPTQPAPVSVQTMTAGYTHEIDKCVAEINRLAAAGADVVRLAVPEKKDTQALTEILNQTRIPIVADVHFHYQRALEAVEAGIHKIRLNPGNIQDRDQVNAVIDACKQANGGRGIPIRIGVNEGSIIERRDKQKRAKELAAIFSGAISASGAGLQPAERSQPAEQPPPTASTSPGGAAFQAAQNSLPPKHAHLLAIMIAKLEEYLDIFHERGFYDIAISAKSMDAALVIDAYSEISTRFPYPLHLGVTHAGPRETGSIRSVVALGALLSRGIGDTIRISYASDPIFEVEDGLELLYALSLRERKGPDLIACPTCGRIQVDLFTLVQDVRKALADKITIPMKVAVMGCVVNGPGEAEGADVAVFAGDRRGIIYVQGQRVANIPENEILPRLLTECLAFQDRIQRGEAKLGEKTVTIIPPDPLGQLGSGWEKVAANKRAGGDANAGVTPLTVQGR